MEKPLLWQRVTKQNIKSRSRNGKTAGSSGGLSQEEVKGKNIRKWRDNWRRHRIKEKKEGRREGRRKISPWRYRSHPKVTKKRDWEPTCFKSTR